MPPKFNLQINVVPTAQEQAAAPAMASAHPCLPGLHYGARSSACRNNQNLPAVTSCLPACLHPQQAESLRFTNDGITVMNNSYNPVVFNSDGMSKGDILHKVKQQLVPHTLS